MFEDLKHEEAAPAYALCCSCLLASFPTHVLHMLVPTALGWVHTCLQKPLLCLCCLPVSIRIYPRPLSPLHSLLLPPPGPIMMSLRPGSELLDSQTLPPERPLSNSMVQVSPQPLEPMKQPAEDGDQAPFSLLEEKVPKWTTEHQREKSCLTNGFDVFECPPPKTENEVGRERPAGWERVVGCEGNDRRQPAAWLGWALTHLGNSVTTWALNSSHTPR